MARLTRGAWLLVVASITLLAANIARAEERKTGFFDLYGGPSGLLEADVPDWKFAAQSATGGARAGLWINDKWAVTLRTWYVETDAKQRQSSPSDLALLGVSLELLGKWQVNPRWGLYGSLGPAMAVSTLDVQRIGRPGQEDDARSVAPGASAGVGAEVHLLGPFIAFAEFHGSLVYPSFKFPDRTITPRLLHTNGLLGVRLSF